MKYTPEFRDEERDESAAAQAKRRELAACYARVFVASEDGRRVIEDLRKKFGVGRLAFVKGDNGRYDYLAAAIRDGERHVLSDIESALELGTPAISEEQNANTKHPTS